MEIFEVCGVGEVGVGPLLQGGGMRAFPDPVVPWLSPGRVSLLVP